LIFILTLLILPSHALQLVTKLGSLSFIFPMTGYTQQCALLCRDQYPAQLTCYFSLFCVVFPKLDHLVPAFGIRKINFNRTVRIQENNLDSKGLKIGH